MVRRLSSLVFGCRGRSSLSIRCHRQAEAGNVVVSLGVGCLSVKGQPNVEEEKKSRSGVSKSVRKGVFTLPCCLDNGDDDDPLSSNLYL